MNKTNDSSEPSVYSLIKQLCSSLIKESEESVENFSLNCAKKIAFNTLLKNNCGDVPDDEQLLKELQFASFELSIVNKIKESKVVNQFIDELNEKPKEICWLLLHLKNIDPDPESEKQKVSNHVVNRFQHVKAINLRFLSITGRKKFLQSSSEFRASEQEKCLFVFKVTATSLSAINHFNARR